MKRDMDLVRAILQKIEEHPRAGEYIQIHITGREYDEISYHVRLLADAKLVDAKEFTGSGGAAHLPRGLTWQGHEFLEASRDDKRWKTAKDTVMSKTGGIAFELIKEVLIDGAKRALFGGP